MSELRQLHHGLPDLFLYDRRRCHRPRWRPRRALEKVGFLLHARLLPYPRRQRPHFDRGPLPPVVDPQARDLDRSVRQLRLCRLRPLYHLVPRGHRPHRRGGRHPGE